MADELIMTITGTSLFWAFLGGIIPALLWLWFWLREDRARPEPRGLIVATFIAGMAAVPIALFLEQFVAGIFISGSFVTIILWASIEEIGKFTAAWTTALRKRDNDEPIDSMMYLITTALGFAAAENALFLLGPLGGGDIMGGFITGNLRFIGSTLLHIVSSGAVGIFMAYSFCELPRIKRLAKMFGLILAIMLHTLFNFFILTSDNNLFAVFSFVWIGVIILFLFFELVKRRNRTCLGS